MANTNYVRYTVDNQIADPQPSSTTVNQFSGTEGWSTVTYEDFNADYVPRNADNTVRTPGTYQASKQETLIILQELQQHISVMMKIMIQY